MMPPQTDSISDRSAEDTLDEIKNCLEATRAQLSDILFEIDDIELQINPQIEDSYRIQIGCFENELLKAQIAARRAKRKLNLAQAHVNRNESVSDEELEGILDSEFTEWEAKLTAQIALYMQALEHRSSWQPLTIEESRELKRLHRSLIKRLHPDVNVGFEEECKRFFLIAQNAYENGDLMALRSVDVATSHLGRSSRNLDCIDEANAEIAILETQVSIAKQRLHELKSSNPFLLKEKLEDPAWVTTKVTGLKAQIEQQRLIQRRFDEELGLLKGQGNG